MTQIRKAGNFGKLPKGNKPSLKLEKYLVSGTPVPPEVDKLAEVYRKIKISDPTVLFPMDCNDTLGCCGIAGLAHKKTIDHGLIYDKNILSADWVKKFYFNFTGGQDSGVVLQDVLEYWRTHDVDGEPILGYAEINPKNIDHVRLALEVFGSLYMGFNVQEDAINDFEAGKTWTSGQLTGDGHCVVCGEFNTTGGTVLTWGNTQKFDLKWWNECVDEVWVTLPRQAKYPAFSGIDFVTMQKDLISFSNGTYKS
jgi:hypothetical protein